jgi:hypothetical protein
MQIVWSLGGANAMKYFASMIIGPTPAKEQEVPVRGRGYLRALIVIGAVLLLFTTAISRSYYDGRLANPLTHDDINFFVEGIQHLTLLRTEGVLALIADLIHGSLHAPISTYQAMIAYLLFGIQDWAPYVLNIVYLFIFFGFAAYLLRDCPVAVLVAALIWLMLLPLSSNGFTEFAPEVICSLFTAIGAVLMIRMPLIEAQFRSRFLAAFCFNIGFLGHPSAFPFTVIALLATVGFTFLRDVVCGRKPGKFRTGIAYAALNIVLSIWLPVLYMVPRYREYQEYFYDSLFNPATAQIWFKTAREPGGRLRQVLFYLSGDGGEFMFGERLFAYLGLIAVGHVAAWWQRDHQSLIRQTELLLFAALFWLLPTLSAFKNYLFASAFGFLLAFMAVMALRSIYRALGGRRGAWAVAASAVLILVFYKPAEYEFYPPNTPAEHVADREFVFHTLDEFKTVLLGNAPPNPRGTQVYMTNQGAYAPAMLQYYMLKTDPTLNWSFVSHWKNPDPQDHLDFIHRSGQEFVIAGQRGNGLTYSPIAWAAEDAVFAGMWRDPNYMPIDRFYGPQGGAIAIFQRRGNFAGWRQVSGMVVNGSKRPDDLREVPNGLAYLQTFAAHATDAELEIEWTGKNLGQKLSVFINYEKVAELTFNEEATSSSLTQKINLAKGINDILLQSDAPWSVQYLLVVPDVQQLTVPTIVPPVSSVGITVASATYGANCRAVLGNATRAVGDACNGKSECAYKVDIGGLRDPAHGCDKDFTVAYFCPSETIMKRVRLAAPAERGKVAVLRCLPGTH